MRKKLKKHSYHWPFQRMKDVLKADYGIVNQEGPITYLARLDTKISKLHSATNVKLSEQLQGYIAARQYGLSEEEFQRLLSLTGGDSSISKLTSRA